MTHQFDSPFGLLVSHIYTKVATGSADNEVIVKNGIHVMICYNLRILFIDICF